MVGSQLSVQDLFSHPINFLGMGFGSGLSPWAPGTMGTLVAVPIYLLLAQLSLTLYLIITLVVFLVGIGICDITAQNLGVHDHPAIVWDEIAGFLLTMTGAPREIGWLILGFALFRLFDVLKPWPIGWLDRNLSGGLGIMLDDMVAGFLALLCMMLLARLVV